MHVVRQLMKLYRSQWNKQMKKTEIHSEMTSTTTFRTLTMITIYLVLPTLSVQDVPVQERNG